MRVTESCLIAFSWSSRALRACLSSGKYSLHTVGRISRGGNRRNVLLVFGPRCLDSVKELLYAVTCHARDADGGQVSVELVEDETHAVHQTVHVRWLAFVVCRALVRRERCLKRLKVLHPLYRKVMWLHIRFVEDENEGQFCFVQNTAPRIEILAPQRYREQDGGLTCKHKACST